MTTFNTYLLILIMNQPNEIQRQQHQRFTEIFNQGKQRYIQAVGNSKSYLSSVKGKDYLSDEEREEAKQLLKQIFQTPTTQLNQRDSDMARGNRGVDELKS
ncbi:MULTISPECIES: hypothetical protein [unclassified Microcystis]|uniref:hypothetical protein n=2 Tax=unclassified Microcystis TaxID=2643300 RepID=UPI0025851739|nr:MULTISPECIES: hypothetical protein [unclassified Microcystis]